MGERRGALKGRTSPRWAEGPVLGEKAQPKTVKGQLRRWEGKNKSRGHSFLRKEKGGRGKKEAAAGLATQLWGSFLTNEEFQDSNGRASNLAWAPVISWHCANEQGTACDAGPGPGGDPREDKVAESRFSLHPS